MVEQHIASGAGVTVAALRAPIDQADQFGVIETAADGREIAALPREAEGRRSGCPTRPTRSSPRWATTSSPPDALLEASRADAEDEASKHDLGGEHHPDARRAGRGAGLRLLAQRGARARRSATAATGATSGRSTRSTTRTWTSSRSTRSSTSTTASGRSSPGREPLPPAKFVFDEDERHGARARLDGLRRRRRLRRRGAPLGPLAERARPLLRAGRGLGPHAGRRGRPQRGRARAILDKNVRRSRPARRSASTPEADRERFTVSDGGIVVIPRAPSWRRSMRVALLTREYPPEVYGGAGVHVEYLARELRAARGRRPSTLGRDARRARRASRTARGTRSPATRRTSPRCGRCRST